MALNSVWNAVQGWLDQKGDTEGHAESVRGYTTKTVTIALNGSLSTEVDLEGYALAGLHTARRLDGGGADVPVCPYQRRDVLQRLRRPGQRGNGAGGR